MRHYIIPIAVSADVVKVIREEFTPFIEQAEVMRIAVENEGKAPSPALQEAFRHLFLRLLISLEQGKFEGLN